MAENTCLLFPRLKLYNSLSAKLLAALHCLSGCLLHNTTQTETHTKARQEWT